MTVDALLADKTFNISVISCLLTNCLILFLLYATRRKERQFLVLGVVMLFSAIRFISSYVEGDGLATLLYYVGYYGFLVSLVFLCDMLLGLSKRHVALASISVAGSLSSYPLFLHNASIVNECVATVFGFLIVSMVAVYTVKLFRRKSLPDLLFGISLVGLLAAGVYELIASFFLGGYSDYLLLWSLVICLLADYVILSKYNASFDSLERANDSLAILNTSYYRFVPKEMLRFIGRNEWNDVKLGDNSICDMAIMFTDIRGFTTLSENMEPIDVFNLLNGLFANIGPIITKNGGIINKYLGDGFLAIVPCPIEKALDCALEIQDYLSSRSGARIDMGIGIHYGKTIFGTVGDRDRMEATVISDVVNTASRLEELTKDYRKRIIVSGEVVGLVARPEDYDIENLGATKVKGRCGSVTVFSVERRTSES